MTKRKSKRSIVDKKSDHEKRLAERRKCRIKGKNPKGLDFVDKQRISKKKEMNKITKEVCDVETTITDVEALGFLGIIVSRKNRQKEE